MSQGWRGRDDGGRESPRDDGGCGDGGGDGGHYRRSRRTLRRKLAS
jgi:hypothetical protein